MTIDVASEWTNFVTQMVGLSVATERVTETIKQWVVSAPADVQAAARKSLIVQVVAIISGALVVGMSGLNPMGMPGFEPYSPRLFADWMCWLVTGFLVSGGSAFWNHLLDILKATKVKKEEIANAAALAQGRPTIPS
jgi:hypothetical protein